MCESRDELVPLTVVSWSLTVSNGLILPGGHESV